MEAGLVTFGPYERFARLRLLPSSTTTVFVIHGSCAHSAQFQSVFDALLPLPVSVAAVDLVGCGESPKPRAWEAYAPDAIFAEAWAFFEAHRAACNVLIGHSTGSSLCAQIWDEHRRAGKEERGAIAGLALLGTALELPSVRPPVFYLPEFLLSWMQPSMTEQFLGMAFTEAADPAVVEGERRASNGNAMHMCKAYYRQWEWRMPLAEAALKLEGGAKRSEPRILIMQGAQDGVLPLQCARDLYEALVDTFESVTMVEVDGASHQVMQEKPGEAVPPIVALVEACLAAGGAGN